jgi:adenosylhomocysteine nucleosidase
MNIEAITRYNTLIVVALEDELPSQLVAGWNVLYTGVGKVNAAIAATEAVLATRPVHVINYGTAGALRPDVSGLVRVNHLVQRDMDVRPLGFDLGHTPFDTTGHIDLGGQGISCGTGDHFVTTPPELMTDIVDMEAYALAKVARVFAVQFHCYKYISDNANEDAADHWAENVARGAEAFVTTVIAPLNP